MLESLRDMAASFLALILLLSPLWYPYVKAWLDRRITARVEHQFNERLEDHKHQLQMIAEEERFYLQRRLASSSLYLQKQHTAAAEIYTSVRMAHGAVSNLFGGQRVITLDHCNEQDLREMLEARHVLAGKREELISLWQHDPRAGTETIRQHIRDLQVPTAEAELQKARNTMYVNEIYFSDSTILAFDQFVGECTKWLQRRQFPPERGEQVESISRDALDKSLERVQQTLRTELWDSPAKQRISGST